jgi:NADH-quinone oxidoreductase subunit N
MKELVLLSSLGVLSLIAGLLRIRKPFFALVVIGLLFNIGLCISDWNASTESLYNMMTVDHFALAFTMVSSIIALLWLLANAAFFSTDDTFSDHFALVLFSITGGFMLLTFTNMVILFLGIEILSIPLFVLAGSNKTNLTSNEAAYKYFLLGAFASAFLLFGITLIYGSTGHFDTAGIAAYFKANNNNGMAITGMVLILAAMTFKVSAAPFHFWAADVYQGAPTPVTTFMATFVKTIAFAGFFKLFHDCFMPLNGQIAQLIAIFAATTMLIANLTASVQSNAKRLLAFSSISHAGFMLVTILCVEHQTAGILLYYALVYSLSSIVAFTIYKLVKEHSQEDESLNAFNGLFKNNPVLSVIMILALLSMAGIPPMPGFMAKYLVFAAAIQNGYAWIALIGILGSVIGVYYYFKMVLNMFKQDHELSAIKVPNYQLYVLMLCVMGLIALMIFPSAIIGLL